MRGAGCASCSPARRQNEAPTTIVRREPERIPRNDRERLPRGARRARVCWRGSRTRGASAQRSTPRSPCARGGIALADSTLRRGADRGGRSLAGARAVVKIADVPEGAPLGQRVARPGSRAGLSPCSRGEDEPPHRRIGEIGERLRTSARTALTSSGDAPTPRPVRLGCVPGGLSARDLRARGALQPRALPGAAQAVRRARPRRSARSRPGRSAVTASRESCLLLRWLSEQDGLAVRRAGLRRRGREPRPPPPVLTSPAPCAPRCFAATAVPR